MIEAVRRAVDIVEVIQEVVPLKKSGSNFFGRCPFHNEKSPSFSVSPSKQLFHCFGCKAGGDVFKFIQLYHGWEFQQALEELAKRAGIKIEKFKVDPQWEEGFAILETVGQIFEDHLQAKAGEHFRDYLQIRGIPSSLWKPFRLGAHAGDPKWIVRTLSDKKFSLDLSSQLGLIGRTERGEYIDRFQGRLMFPIMDERGKIRGFGGRILKNEHPKYINSPKSSHFDKGRLFYGMHLACRDISRKGYAVLVEGYLDVLALNQFGVTNVIGSMGTALTIDQARLMKRWSQKAISLYDSDSAGLAATERNLSIFLKEGIESKVAMIPTGKDPDQFLHDQTHSEVERKAALKKIFEAAVPAVDYLVEKTVLVEKTAVGKGKRLRALVSILDQIPDDLQRAVVKKELAKKFELAENLLLKPQDSPKPMPAPKQAKMEVTDDRWEREIVRFLVQYGDRQAFEVAEFRPYLLPSSKWTSLLVRFLDLGLESRSIAGLGWLTDCEPDTQAVIREWSLEPVHESELSMLWADLLKGTRRAYFRRESERLQRELSQADERKDMNRSRELLSEKRDLVRLMRASEGSATELLEV